MPGTQQRPKLKFRWLRFSLRSFLVSLTIGCLLIGYWVHRAERQKAVVKWVEDNWGQAYYDFENVGVCYYQSLESARSGSKERKAPYAFFELDDKYSSDVATPSGPEWVQKLFGNDYRATVKVVNLHLTGVKDMAPLARLEQLTIVSLEYTNVTDLTPLGGLTNLEHLKLNNTPVSNLTALAGLRKLENLDLRNTRVADVKPLKGLKNLKLVDLYNTQVTQEQIDNLREALPNCNVRWSPPDKAVQGN